MTSTEDLLKQLKRSSKSKAILVPRIETFLQRPIDVDDDYDREFLARLIEARSKPRKKGVYSPSMLSSCVRQVYFTKTGVKGKRLPRPDSNAIFLDGNFRHFKWQFTMWKMHRAGIIQLVDVGSIALGSEIYVENERGDYGGTLDNLIYIPEIDFLSTVDWKGMNGNGFAGAVARGPGLNYVIQSVGYAGLANHDLVGLLPKKIENVLIIGENKNGAIRNRMVNSPLGLREWKINIEDYNHLVAARLKKLRAYERKRKTPPPECTSTRSMKFKDCPFSYICLGEVQAIERKNKKLRLKKNKATTVMFNKVKRPKKSKI